MNKIFDVFAKGRRRKESFNTLCCADNVCDNNSSRKIVFKYYQFDSDQYNILTSDPAFGIVPKRREERQNDQTCSASGETESCILDKDFSSDLYHKHTPTANLCLLHGKEQGQAEQKSVSERQMYVIRISNSKSFHIGPQKTVNINPQFSGPSATETICTSVEPKLNLSRLLDSEERLSEDCILFISLHLEKKWKEFGKNLGLEETFFEEQEDRNGSNGILIAYDMLQKYRAHFPNTSLGFIVYILIEIHHIQLIEKLLEELKNNAYLVNTLNAMGVTGDLTLPLS